jgi:hypothetical protein
MGHPFSPDGFRGFSRWQSSGSYYSARRGRLKPVRLIASSEAAHPIVNRAKALPDRHESGEFRKFGRFP